MPAAYFRALLHTIKPLPARAENLRCLASSSAPHLKNLGGSGILLLADCALIPNPDVNELAAIALETGKLAHHFLGRKPLVAMLSHSTKGSASTPDAQRMAAAASLAQAEALKQLPRYRHRRRTPSRRRARPRSRRNQTARRPQPAAPPTSWFSPTSTPPTSRSNSCNTSPAPKPTANSSSACRARPPKCPAPPPPKPSSAPPPPSPWKPSNSTNSIPTAKSEPPARKHRKKSGASRRRGHEAPVGRLGRRCNGSGVGHLLTPARRKPLPARPAAASKRKVLRT